MKNFVIKTVSKQYIFLQIDSVPNFLRVDSICQNFKGIQFWDEQIYISSTLDQISKPRRELHTYLKYKICETILF